MTVERELAKEVGHFLSTDSKVAQINFYVGITKRIPITGKGIRKVGDKLQAGDIRVEINDKKVGKKAGARFIRDERLLVLKKSWLVPEETRRFAPHMGVFMDTAALRSLAVHEAVHAIVESGGRRIVQLNDEAAAYLAQVVWLLRHGTFSAALSTDTTGANHILHAAKKVVEQCDLRNHPGRHVRREQLRPLLRAISGHELYDDLGWLERY